ncbi:SRPBCC family protein [Brevundimonas sp. Root1279]|uniref:SRPBCC family protein n=1 Tax=Brevundimonas sp. Root1279 TaxID=1736443 RepID=UPI0006F1C545|nr:SRPBCC family protein [Brevundimonas sp. Root1279]KQW80739.1 cyclase [Brevundimonas sp. Root1279]
MSETAPSTDADVQSTAYTDDDRVEGEFEASSVRAVMINRPRQALYAFWRDFKNLPTFMENVKSVELMDGDRSSWVVAGPAGSEVELVSEITEDRPGEYIAWRSLRESDIDHEGWIEFRDNAFGRGTEVRVFISYDPPAGTVGKLVAKVLQREPRVQARRELRRFKQLMETGEIPTSKAPDAAPRADRHW